MRWDSFAGTLVFAAAAALTLPAVWLGLGPILGHENAASLYLLVVAVVYVSGLRPEGRLPRRAVFLAASFGALLLVFTTTLAQVAVGAALLVAWCRSGLVYSALPARRARALGIEALLGVGGLLLAGFVSSGGVLGLTLALWSYLLLQSSFFLIGGRGGAARPRPAQGAPDDEYARARASLLRLLEEDA